MESSQVQNETLDNCLIESKELKIEEPLLGPKISSNENEVAQNLENTQQQDVEFDDDTISELTDIKQIKKQDEPKINPPHQSNNITDEENKNNNTVIDVSQMFNERGPRTVERELFDNVEDGFVMIDVDDEMKYEKHRQSFYQQMETILSRQINQCELYKKFFEEQNNVTMANKFAAYSLNSTKNLDLLKLSCKNNEMLPKYRFEHISFNCLPINSYIRDKEVQINVKASNLPVEKNAVTYIIGEFAYPHSKDEPLTETIARWIRYSTLDPKNFVSCCSSDDPRQLDSIYSVDTVPFNEPECKRTMFNRPLSFFIEKGKSRTLKRKFKLIKLTFYEKKDIFSFDRKIGTVQCKIDGINDEISIVTRQYIMDGRRQTDASVDIRVRVREALVNRSIRAHEEKLLLLT